jgi:hypothetical protein
VLKDVFLQDRRRLAPPGIPADEFGHIFAKKIIIFCAKMRKDVIFLPSRAEPLFVDLYLYLLLDEQTGVRRKMSIVSEKLRQAGWISRCSAPTQHLHAAKIGKTWKLGNYESVGTAKGWLATP